MKKTIVLTTLLALVSSDVFAKRKKRRSKKSSRSYAASYGMAGCGIWSSVIKDNTMGAQLGVFALRNFVLNSQTTAISSGLSNCVENSQYSSQDLEQEVFVEVNYNSLLNDAARGQGETLYNLSEVFGCKDFANFAKMSQANFESLYNSSAPKDVISSYAKAVEDNTELSCSRLT